MSLFVKIETDALTNAKLLDAGLAATAVWLRGLLYSKVHLTDGFVPAPAIRLLALGADDPEGVAQDLVACGLWHDAPGGWTVGPDNWARHQTSREQVEAKREADAERKRLARASRVREVSARSPNGRDTDAPDVSAPRPQSVRAESVLQSTEHRAQSTEHKLPKERVRNVTPPDEPDAQGTPTSSAPAPKKRKARKDSLADHPTLRDAYADLRALVLERHQFAKPSEAWQSELAAAVRLDGVDEADLVAAIRWTFTADTEDARFWRKQVQGFGGLRASKGGKPSKLSRILNAWASAGGKRRPDPAPAPDERAVELPDALAPYSYRLRGAGLGRASADNAILRLASAHGEGEAGRILSAACDEYQKRVNRPLTLEAVEPPDVMALIHALEPRHSPNGTAKASTGG